MDVWILSEEFRRDVFDPALGHGGWACQLQNRGFCLVLFEVFQAFQRIKDGTDFFVQI
jgi:hypothetical protein